MSTENQAVMIKKKKTIEVENGRLVTVVRKREGEGSIKDCSNFRVKLFLGGIVNTLPNPFVQGRITRV